MGFHYDTTGVAESSTFEPVPEDTYNVEIEKVQDSTNLGTPLKSGNGDPLIRVRYKILEGKYKDRKLFDQICFIKKGNKGDGIAKHFLHVIDEPFEGVFDVKPENWVGKQLAVTVKIGEYQGKAKNEVVSREPYAIPF